MLLWLLACAKEPALDTAGLVEPVEDVVQPLDMENPTDNTMAFAKMRGSLQSDEEVVFYWHGYIYNHELQDPYAETETSYSASPIMAFEGYNIARLEKISDTEYLMLSREITVYKNLFGKIIDCFDNRAVNAEDSEWVPVVHVQNDPVNFVVGESDYKEIGNLIVWDMDIFLAYPSPLPVEDYPQYSASNTYQSIELFDFYADRSDLENPALDTVPVHLSWVRKGQYLPWMKAGQKEGGLIYHAQGYKILEGWDGLPEELKEWTEEHAPEYKHAPERDTYGSNMTSWRYMKKILQEGNYPTTCQ